MDETKGPATNAVWKTPTPKRTIPHKAYSRTKTRGRRTQSRYETCSKRRSRGNNGEEKTRPLKSSGLVGSGWEGMRRTPVRHLGPYMSVGDRASPKLPIFL